MDLLDRSIPGFVIYTILWPIIFISVGLHHTLPLFCWSIAAAFASLSLLRYIHKRTTDYLYDISQRLWLGIFAVLSISQASLMGTLFAFSLIDEQLLPVKILMVVAASGLSGGAMNALNVTLWLATASVGMMLLPAIFTSLVIEHNYPMAMLITIYLLYLFILGRRSHHEYIRAFKIENQLNEQQLELEQLNKIDPLTHIYNRGYFDNTFDFQWNSGLRNKQKQSILLIDIDNFKSINDNHGHLFGDQCIKTIANIIDKTAKRKTDVVARFGGDEFVVLLSDTSCQEAYDMAKKICVQIETQKISLNNVELKVTASLGVSCLLPQSDIQSDTLISMADKALYRAKSDGRNCVVCFPYCELKSSR